MPTTTISFCDEDWAALGVGAGRSTRLRAMLKAAREHKCPAPTPCGEVHARNKKGHIWFEFPDERGKWVSDVDAEGRDY